jgi:hypothetical protein
MFTKFFTGNEVYLCKPRIFEKRYKNIEKLYGTRIATNIFDDYHQFYKKYFDFSESWIVKYAVDKNYFGINTQILYLTRKTRNTTSILGLYLNFPEDKDRICKKYTHI